MSEIITIVRAGASAGVDRYGNDVPGADIRIRVHDVLVAPRAAGDADGDGRTGVIVGLTLFLPATAPPVLASDRIEVRGEVHEIEGDPGVWIDPGSGFKVGTEVNTQRVEG